mgnify:CR=1 FL=1
MEGEASRAVNIAGGLHHAMPEASSGFCVYNDIAVGIRRLLDLGAERVPYLALDVHHGDGVERCFWNDPRVQKQIALLADDYELDLGIEPETANVVDSAVAARQLLLELRQIAFHYRPQIRVGGGCGECKPCC